MIVAVLLALVAALGARTVRIAYPGPTSDGEHRLVKGVSVPAFDERTLQSRFYYHVIETRPLLALGIPESRAAYVNHVLVGVLGLLLGALAARRLFGARALWIFLLLGAMSTIDLNYTARTNGVIHAGAFLCLAALCFTSRWRFVWVIGGVALAASFAHRYHSGLTIASFAAAVVWHDAAALWCERDWKRALVRAIDRIWVAGVAAGALYLAVRHVGQVYGHDQFEVLLDHKNLEAPQTHSSFHWLWMLIRLDPIVWMTVLTGVSYAAFRCREAITAPLREPSERRFVDAALMLRWAACMVVGYTLLRSFSGMARQVAPAIPVLLIAGAGIFSRLSLTALPRWRWFLGAWLLAALALLSSATLEQYTNTSYRENVRRIKQHLEQRHPNRKVEVLEYEPHYLNSENGYRRVKTLARAPDFVVGGDRLLPFNRFDEESHKVDRVERRLEKSEVTDWIDLPIIFYAAQFYVTPPLEPAEYASFVRSLPPRLRRPLRRTR